MYFKTEFHSHMTCSLNHMLTALIVGLLTALPFNELTSQNLVVNGGFEEYSFVLNF